MLISRGFRLSQTSVRIQSNIIFGIIIAFSSYAWGQTIVNTEKLFDEDSSRLKFSSELMGSAISGNANVFLLEYSLNGVFQSGKNQFMLLTGGEFINEDKQIVSNSHFGQFRYSFIQSDWITPFVFYQLQSNEILLLTRRQLAGVGNKMTIFRMRDKDSSEVFVSRLSIGAMLEEELLNRSKLPEPERIYTNYLRGSLNLILSIGVSDKFRLINTTYYQPYLRDFFDFRLLNETNLLFEVTDKLNFTVDFEVRYDSDPPSILRNTDFNSNFGIVLKI